MNKIAKILILTAFLALLFTGCSFFIAQKPRLTLVESKFGSFNSLPEWQWTTKNNDSVGKFRYSLDNPGSLTEVDNTVTGYRVLKSLTEGSHTFYLQASTTLGFWSDMVKSSISVSYLAATEFLPDDPYYDPANGEQWNLQMISMGKLWGILKTSFIDSFRASRDNTIVAVVDTGYTEHPEVIGRILTGEGYDFISDVDTLVDPNDGDGIDPDATDAGDDDGTGYGNSWHGTGVTGIIVAATNNGTGTAGISPDQHILVLPVRVLGIGGGRMYDVLQGILYAAGLDNDSGLLPTHPAKIINLSLGSGNTPAESPVFEAGLKSVMEKGIIVVAATGNDGANFVSYPASSQYTIAVSAVDATKSIASYSNSGDEVDIAAPGGDGNSYILVPSPDPNANQPLGASDYGFLYSQGTSDATPHVTGLLALLETVDDLGDLSDVLSLLENTAIDLGEPGWDADYGYGLVDGESLFTRFTGVVGDFSGTKSFGTSSKGSLGIAGGLTEGSVAGSFGTRGLLTGNTGNPKYDKSSLIVMFKRPLSAQKSAFLYKSLGIKSISGRSERLKLLRIQDTASLDNVLANLKKDPDVEAVQYNYRMKPF